jgi:hypothetical protein
MQTTRKTSIGQANAESQSYVSAESLIAHLPGAAVAVIDGPHLLLQSCPEECSAAVLKFMTAQQILARSA